MGDDLDVGLADLRMAIEDDAQLSKSLGKYLAAGDKVRMGSPTLHWGSLEVDGSSPNAAAMSAALLTVVKASYRHVPVLQAKDAAKKLGIKQSDLPDGFYVLSGDGKIAAAMFPMTPTGSSFRSESNPAVEKFKALSGHGGKLASMVEAGAFCTDMRFNIDKLFSNARNFSLSLMTEKGSSKESFESFGFASSTTIMEEGARWSAKAQKGYPAFVDFGDVPLGDLASAKNYEIPFLKCMGLPIHNHCGYSLINNVRELLSAKEREPERAQIFESLMEKWLEAKMTESSQRDDQVMHAAGIDDEDGSYWKSAEGIEHAKALRQQANKASRSNSIGSERQMVCNPNSTSYFHSGGSKMIGSLDFALVDGQHSSIDYAILASAVDVQARGAPKEQWLGFDKGADQSAPEALRKRFEEELPRLAKAKGMSKSQVGKAQREELWQDFASFCRGATTTIRVTTEANPSNQIQKVNEANNRKAQKAESMTILERKDEIAEFIELVNEEAMRRGSPVMLTQTKSLISNPDFAGVASDSTIEFEKIFPALFAVSRTYDSSQERARKSNLLFGFDEEGDEVIAKQLSEALGVRKNAPKMKDLVERTRALVNYVGKFKGREHKIAKASLSAFLGKSDAERGFVDQIAGMVGGVQDGKYTQPKNGKSSFNKDGFLDLALEESEKYQKKWGPKFDDFSDFIKMKFRMFATGNSPYELSRETRAKIAYEIFDRAYVLTEAISTAEPIEAIMSADLCENIMI